MVTGVNICSREALVVVVDVLVTVIDVELVWCGVVFR